MRWDKNYDLKKTELEYDIFLVSNGGMGFAPGIENIAPLGGTELECNFLLGELAKLDLKVGSYNNLGAAIRSDKVDCYPLADNKILNIKTKILINMRGIPPPTGIAFQRICHWLTDNINPQNPYYMDSIPPDLRQITVAVSDYHRNQCKPYWNAHRIYNMVPDNLYSLPHVKKDPYLFVYASAAMKGLPETLKLWKEMSNHYVIKKSKLLVCSPGYDNPDMEELRKTKNVEFIGALKFSNLVDVLSKATGLFQVNRMPETFGLVYAFAEAVGTAPHALCLNGPGALLEVVNTPTITNDVKAFGQNIIDYSTGKSKPLMPKNFRTSSIMPNWVSLLESVIK